MSIGKNIKHCRKARKLTQKQLADMINKTDRSIQKYENDTIEPPISVINDIAKALMISITDLIPVIENKVEVIKAPLSEYSTRELLEELLRRTD